MKGFLLSFSNRHLTDFFLFFVVQFNSRFERRNLKHLRVFLKQPSPSWLDFSIRNLTAFTKRIDYSQQQQQSSMSTQSTRLNSAGSSSAGAASGGNAGFDSFKSRLRQNLQGVKKQTKQVSANYSVDEEGGDNGGAVSTAKLVGSAVHHYTEEVRRLDICPGFQ